MKLFFIISIMKIINSIFLFKPQDYPYIRI